MSESIWDGRLNLQNDLQRAEGANIPLSAAELRKLVTEIVATQKGTLHANNAARAIINRLTYLEARADGETRAVLQAAIEGFHNLTAAVTAAGAAVGELFERPAQSGEIPDWSALAEGLTTSSDATTHAVERLCARLDQRDQQRDDLLGEFGGDAQLLRFWITQALHSRRITARTLGVDERDLRQADVDLYTVRAPGT